MRHLDIELDGKIYVVRLMSGGKVKDIKGQATFKSLRNMAMFEYCIALFLETGEVMPRFQPKD